MLDLQSSINEKWYGELALKILFSSEAGYTKVGINPDDLAHLHWDFLLNLLKKNIITIRALTTLKGIEPNPSISAMFDRILDKENARTSRMLQLIGKISQVFEEEGIDFLVIKTLDHYPDMGNDVDIFVLDGYKGVDAVIKNGFGASVLEASVGDKLAGKRNYKVNGYPFALEVHYNRLGQVGEHKAYPKILMRNRQTAAIDGIKTFIPSPEDQLILRVIQRIYRHFNIRISDVFNTINALNHNDLNWNYLLDITKQIGIFEGLCLYMSYMNQIYRKFFEYDMLSPDLGRVLIKNGLEDLGFKNLHYRFPLFSIPSKVYLKKFFSDFKDFDWEGVGRLSLLLPLALITLTYLKVFKRQIVW